MKKWQTLSSELAFDNKWFKVQKDVVKLPNGRILDDFYLWKEPMVAQIVAITKQGKIVLVKQYKHGVGEVIIECPAGFVDEGENFESAAKRELLEETGYKANSLEFLGKFTHNPTKSLGIVYSYLAMDLEKVEQNLDTDEEIELLELNLDKAIDMIKRGEIWTSGTVTSIFLALNKINNN